MVSVSREKGGVSREWKVPECGNEVRNEVRRGARSRARDAQAAAVRRGVWPTHRS